jgi:hypothetical protein
MSRVRLTDDEQYVDDLLDILPYVTEQLQSSIFDEAIIRYKAVLDQHQDPRIELSRFVVIHHSETYFIRGTWGEDSVLDGDILPEMMFFWNKLKQIFSAHIGTMRGYNFVETAITDVVARHGEANTIDFLNRAWTQRLIIHPEHAYIPMWLLARAKVFGIDYRSSRSEYESAFANSTKEKSNRKGRFSRAALAKIDVKASRNWEGLVDHYLSAREDAEQALTAARRCSSASEWLSQIRNLVPQFISLMLIAEEAEHCAKINGRRADVTPLSRFVDERQADIKTSLVSLFWTPAYTDIASAGDKRAQLRRAKIYRNGRVVFPDFVYDHVVQMLSAGTLNLDAIEQELWSGLRPGHRWVLQRREELIKAALDLGGNEKES